MEEISTKLAKINRVETKDDTHYFKDYISKLDTKESIDPNKELALIFGIASKSVVDARSAFLNDCDALVENKAHFPKIDRETPRLDQETQLIVEEEVCKKLTEMYNRPASEVCFDDTTIITDQICHNLAESNQDALNECKADPTKEEWECQALAENHQNHERMCFEQKGFSFKGLFKKIVNSIRSKFESLDKFGKKAFKKAKKLAKNFVKIVSHGVSGVYQLVTEGKIDLDEVKRRDGFSKWFDSTVDSLDDLASRITEQSRIAAESALSYSVNLGEITVQLVKGDTDGAKKALKRAEENARDAVRAAGKTLIAGVD